MLARALLRYDMCPPGTGMWTGFTILPEVLERGLSFIWARPASSAMRVMTNLLGLKVRTTLEMREW